MNIAVRPAEDLAVKVDLDDCIPELRSSQGVMKLRPVPEAVNEEEKRKGLNQDKKGEANTRPTVLSQIRKEQPETYI